MISKSGSIGTDPGLCEIEMPSEVRDLSSTRGSTGANQWSSTEQEHFPIPKMLGIQAVPHRSRNLSWTK